MEFIDLQAQYRAYRADIDAAVRTVLETSRYINGPQVADLEKRLAEFVGTHHGVGFSSGTDALLAVLMAWGIAPGDEVITTPFTFIATAEVIALLGAKPVFVDVEPDTLTLDPNKITAAITPHTKAIIPVSLFGHCADFDAINAVASQHGIPCLEDACQSLGSSYKGRRSGALSTASAVSFFPSKPLGCYGDGGMVFTDDDALMERLRVLREHGQTMRYHHAVLGLNGRLDTLQAAILLAKLPHFEAELAARQQQAQHYLTGLSGLDRLRLPVIRPDCVSVFSQFTIRVHDRDRVQHRLAAAGVPTAIHYPISLHQQPVFVDLLHHQEHDFPVAAQAAKEVLSLPMHAFLARDQQDHVIESVRKVVMSE
ncbi:MAG: DegT/DnrJ/EryC1/StrS family aminotransferase [Magnetococcales bacterium]|nr:DegT/DnrJ/EryC1/StrS family aminotransferase [Magnetococcales bacterium]